ncbi:hypothetical protein JTE90_018326 [Oedothorax gibbosus]|uniref:Retrotransposon gag domain-containing protein n=1 Tax=Oedothorax gibbosus TaxID=931172 RepID=A0AAV6TGW2_9ARAC|nr:hypothetical protein JTE90_018326 [Oedothorax gibbosus]
MDPGSWGFIDDSEAALDETASSREKTDYNARKTKAFTTIYFSISEEFKPLLSSTTDGKQDWFILKEHFEPKSKAHLMQLLDQFFGTRMQEGETMGLFLSRVKKAAQDIADDDHPVPDLYQAFQAIRYLPMRVLLLLRVNHRNSLFLITQ